MRAKIITDTDKFVADNNKEERGISSADEFVHCEFKCTLSDALAT